MNMRTDKMAISALMLCLGVSGVALTGTGCAGTRTERSTGAYLDDKGVTARVKTALFRDPNVSGFDVHVNTFRGEVQLSGFVDTPEQKEHAASLAQQVGGVREVVNNIEVKPAAAPTAVGTAGDSVQGASRTVTEPAVNPPAADYPNTTPAPVRAPRSSDLDSTTPRSDLTPSDRNLRTDLNTPAGTATVETPAARSDLTTTTTPPIRDNTSRTLPGLAPAASTAPEDLNKPAIDISSANGRFTVRGTVATEEEKRDIAKKLLAIPGVVSVDNQIQVRAPANTR